jgi:TRAP-type C4-dicarboxylate transport system permease small subunit
LYLQQLIINICMLVVAWVMMVEGWYFSVVSLQRLSPALGITLFIPTIIIPVAGALMMLVNAIDIARCCRRLWTGTQ